MSKRKKQDLGQERRKSSRKRRAKGSLNSSKTK
ncbi:hypothetical protein A2U01_0033476, partial [Trifolium medium]|nr:hypothetical protein [Trifolium medium]